MKWNRKKIRIAKDHLDLIFEPMIPPLLGVRADGFAAKQSPTTHKGDMN